MGRYAESPEWRKIDKQRERERGLAEMELELEVASATGASEREREAARETLALLLFGIKRVLTGIEFCAFFCGPTCQTEHV